MTKETKKTRPKLDWIAIRKYYVEHSEVSLADISKKYGVSGVSVGKHSAKEGWVQLRQQVNEIATAKLPEKLGEELSEVNLRHATAWKQAQQLLLANLNIVTAATKKKIDSASGDLSKLDFGDIYNSQYAKFLMEALKEAINGERIAQGLPTAITKSDNDINFNNPFAGFNEEQLEQIIRSNDAKLRARYATEGETTSSNGTSEA